ncbi:MAG: aminopeptidase, partial [Oscillospiraceae bacterium]
MDKEKTIGQKLEDELLYKQPLLMDVDNDVNNKAQIFCEDYKSFLNAAKTEREAATEIENRLIKSGYKAFVVGAKYNAGDKIYYVNRHKAVLCATIGSNPLNMGARMMIAHIDSPRLDLKPNPLYEDNNIALFKTHYYGGLRKYQWGATPLSIHGVVIKNNGEKVTINIGEKEGEPVFCVTDLLPHLAQEQSKR